MIYRIFKDGELVNRIVADEDFCCEHYSGDGYSYELEPAPVVESNESEPTQLDRVEAQVTYTAMMTDTLLPEV